MFWPFALFAATYCGRERFKSSVGSVVSVWVLLLIFGGTTLAAWKICAKLPDSWVWSLFISANCWGGLLMLLRIAILGTRLKYGAEGKAEAGRRTLGRAMGRMRWIPLCGYARDAQDEQARFEPLACFLCAAVSLLFLNVYAWVLLVGSIALAIYEAREEDRQLEEGKEALAGLEARIREAEGTLQSLLVTARNVVDELHVVAAIEAGEDPASPIARRLDDLLRRTCDSYPALRPTMYSVTADASPETKIGAYALAQSEWLEGVRHPPMRVRHHRAAPST